MKPIRLRIRLRRRTLRDFHYAFLSFLHFHCAVASYCEEKGEERREERRGDMDKEDYYSFASGSNPAVPFYIKLHDIVMCY